MVGTGEYAQSGAWGVPPREITKTIEVPAGQAGSYMDGAVTVKDNGHAVVNAGEYEISFTDFSSNHKSGAWINNIEIRSKNANSDGMLPSGLWGATVDGDGHARNGDTGKGTQGGGAIEGLDGKITERGDKETVKLYEVDGLYDTKFGNFNVFDAARTKGPWGPAHDIKVGIDVDVKVKLEAIINQLKCGIGHPPKEAKVVEVEHGRVWGDPLLIVTEN